MSRSGNGEGRGGWGTWRKGLLKAAIWFWLGVGRGREAFEGSATGFGSDSAVLFLIRKAEICAIVFCLIGPVMVFPRNVPRGRPGIFKVVVPIFRLVGLTRNRVSIPVVLWRSAGDGRFTDIGWRSVGFVLEFKVVIPVLVCL